jgi:hypothetical protein
VNPSTYGQAVRLSTRVTAASGTPTGTVEFFDNGSSLGVAPLAGGTASLSTDAVAAGTRSITAVYRGDVRFASSASAGRPQTVNRRSTSSTFTFTPISPQYSDLVTFRATLSPASAGGRQPARYARFTVGAQVMGTVPLVPNPATGALEATLTAPLVETTHPGQMRPGLKLTAVEFLGVDPGFNVTNRTGSLSIRTEDARTAYTGQRLATTACPTCSTATVRLEATVTEFPDGNPGDVRNASVVFINRGTGKAIGTGTLDASRSSPALAIYYFDWTVNIGAKSSQTFRMGTGVANYYARNSPDEDATVTVAKPAQPR